MPKFRIDNTEPAQDGSGDILYDIWAIDDDDLVIPGKHITVRCPYLEVQEVVDATPASQKLKKLKDMLIRNKPASGWDNDDLAEFVANNKNAKIVDEEFDSLIASANDYRRSRDNRV